LIRFTGPLVLAARYEEALHAAADEVERLGGRAFVQPTDVSPVAEPWRSNRGRRGRMFSHLGAGYPETDARREAVMRRSTLGAGAVGGLVAGIVMAMWSMIVLWLIGEGFWTPLNLIAHTFWRDAPVGATFSAGAMILGAIVHMMMSIILGIVYAWWAERSRSGPPLIVAGAVVYGVVVWLVNQYVLWPLIDSVAANAFTPWVFGVGHVMYGLVLGLALLPALRRTRPTTAEAPREVR
jgi:hypothetical protein